MQNKRKRNSSIYHKCITEGKWESSPWNNDRHYEQKRKLKISESATFSSARQTAETGIITFFIFYYLSIINIY